MRSMWDDLGEQLPQRLAELAAVYPEGDGRRDYILGLANTARTCATISEERRQRIEAIEASQPRDPSDLRAVAQVIADDVQEWRERTR
jgi:hypothetical protein